MNLTSLEHIIRDQVGLSQTSYDVISAQILIASALPPCQLILVQCDGSDATYTSTNEFQHPIIEAKCLMEG